jgi:hypothetical protein
MQSSALETSVLSPVSPPVEHRRRSIDGLEKLVDELARCARVEHSAWWKEDGRRPVGGLAAVLGGDPLLLEAIAAGLAAEGPGRRASDAIGPFSARCRALMLRRMRNPLRPMDIARRVDSPWRALVIYTVCRTFIGRTAAGRVVVEDLGEAFMIPLALLREIKVRLRRLSSAD